MRLNFVALKNMVATFMCASLKLVGNMVSITYGLELVGNTYGPQLVSNTQSFNYPQTHHP